MLLAGKKQASASVMLLVHNGNAATRRMVPPTAGALVRMTRFERVESGNHFDGDVTPTNPRPTSTWMWAGQCFTPVPRIHAIESCCC